MTLPQGAATLTGGCSCGAIRYRISVPPAGQRTPSPFAPPEAGLTLPTSILCHCNDCRRHTGSLLPLVSFQVPSHAMTVSVLDAPQYQTSNVATGRFLDVLGPEYDQAAVDVARPPYKPARSVFCAKEAGTTRPTHLRFFHSVNSGEDMSRVFCGHCGSPVAFHIKLQQSWCHDQKLPEEYQDVFDVFAGTLDRWVLDEGWVVPEDEVNWKNGVKTGRQVTATALGLSGLTKYRGLGPMEGAAEEDELKEFRK